jgi:hypothetical protein
MATARKPQIQCAILSAFTILTLSLSAYAKYSGGTGDPNDPYQIATAEDLMLLGQSPEDYDKHFILTADIDLDPNLPGRKVFDKAMIAPKPYWYEGDPFTGFFDGNGHTILNLTIVGGFYLGLFGSLEGEVRNLGVADVNILGSGPVSGLVGLLERNGTVTKCYSTGTVNGNSMVGGLVGSSDEGGIVTQCYSVVTVTSNGWVGGLVGWNEGGIMSCYSAGTVWDTSIEGRSNIGGLVGGGNGSISSCYSTTRIRSNSNHGGLVGGSSPTRVTSSVWDIETSGCTGSYGGVGLTTAEMMDPQMLGLNGFANDPNWILDPGHDYPRLAWEGTPGSVIPEPDVNWMEGNGTKEALYRIDTADQLILLGKASILWDKHFILDADIDLDPNLPGRQVFQEAVIQIFSGILDGNNHSIQHLTINGLNYVGLFGILESEAKVMDLGIVDVNVTGSSNVGGLVGENWGNITDSYSSGTVNGTGSRIGGLVGENRSEIDMSYSNTKVSGGSGVGGLVGWNWNGHITHCYSSSEVTGNETVGGLVGFQHVGKVTYCYSTGMVSGYGSIGGLVGKSDGQIRDSYSTSTVIGHSSVGGLVGDNMIWRAGWRPGLISRCYSTGSVIGNSIVGGLVGQNKYDEDDFGPGGEGIVTESFWDTQTSVQATSAGGTGKTTVEMQTANTFLDAGWDFVGETANGTDDIWWILEGLDYPRLWWELIDDEPLQNVIQ